MDVQAMKKQLVFTAVLLMSSITSSYAADHFWWFNISAAPAGMGVLLPASPDVPGMVSGGLALSGFTCWGTQDQALGKDNYRASGLDIFLDWYELGGTEWNLPADVNSVLTTRVVYWLGTGWDLLGENRVARIPPDINEPRIFIESDAWSLLLGGGLEFLYLGYDREKDGNGNLGGGYYLGPALHISFVRQLWINASLNIGIPLKVAEFRNLMAPSNLGNDPFAVTVSVSVGWSAFFRDRIEQR